jgi:hypothetical protein
MLERPDAVTPAAGAAVMATAVVSTGLALDGREALSRVLLEATVALWLCLGAVFAGRAVRTGIAGGVTRASRRRSPPSRERRRSATG